jgi:hypothetical protein
MEPAKKVLSFGEMRRLIDVVRAWPSPAPMVKGLRAEAKLAFIGLMCKAGGIERHLVTHAANVGREMGASERSGQRALDSLRKAGLIRVPDRFKGEITVFLENPLKVAQHARLGPAFGGQGEFDFANEPPSEAESSPLPFLPRAAATGDAVALPSTAAPLQHPVQDPVQDPPFSKGLEANELKGALQDPVQDPVQDPPKAMLNTLNASIARAPSKEEEHDSRARASEALCPPADLVPDLAQDPPPDKTALRRLRASGKVAPVEFSELERIQRQDEYARQLDPKTVRSVAELIGQKLKTLPLPAQQAARAKEIADWILKVLADPAMARSVAMHVAQAVVEGLLPQAKILDVLSRLERQTERGALKSSRGAYFVGAMGNIFRLLNIPWIKEKRR